jgi:hypothetical protein
MVFTLSAEGLKKTERAFLLLKKRPFLKKLSEIILC